VLRKNNKGIMELSDINISIRYLNNIREILNQDGIDIIILKSVYVF